VQQLKKASISKMRISRKEDPKWHLNLSLLRDLCTYATPILFTRDSVFFCERRLGSGLAIIQLIL
jgi:hypothetical protein